MNIVIRYELQINYEANTATLYRLKKYDIIGTIERYQEEYDLIDVIILRINDKAIIDDEILRLLQVLCSNRMQKAEKLKYLKENGIRIDNMVEEGVNRMCNLSDLVEARGEARSKKEIGMNMLRDGMPWKTVAEYTMVSVELVQEWAKELSIEI